MENIQQPTDKEYMLIEAAEIYLIEIKLGEYLVEKCRTTDLKYHDIISVNKMIPAITFNKNVLIKDINGKIDLRGWELSTLTSLFK